MISTSRRSIVVTAILALFVSMLMSGYVTYRNKQALRRNRKSAAETANERSYHPHLNMGGRSKTAEQDRSKSRWGGWSSTLLPFYVIAVLSYVMYILWKMMMKRYSRNTSAKVSDWKTKKARRSGGTKITVHEVEQIEKRLQESIAAVEQIFKQVNDTLTSAAQVFDEEDNSQDESDVGSGQDNVEELSNKESVSADARRDGTSGAARNPRRGNKVSSDTRNIERDEVTKPQDDESNAQQPGQVESTKNFAPDDTTRKDAITTPSSDDDSDDLSRCSSQCSRCNRSTSISLYYSTDDELDAIIAKAGEDDQEIAGSEKENAGNEKENKPEHSAKA